MVRAKVWDVCDIRDRTRLSWSRSRWCSGWWIRSGKERCGRSRRWRWWWRQVLATDRLERHHRWLGLAFFLAVFLSIVTRLYDYNLVASMDAHVTAWSSSTSQYTLLHNIDPRHKDHLRFLPPPFLPVAPLLPRPLSARACPSSRTCSNSFVFEGKSSPQTLQACYQYIRL